MRAENLSRPQDSSTVTWNAEEGAYRVYGSAGAYRVRITHPEFQDVDLYDVKVEEAGGDDTDHALRTRTLRIEVARKGDSTSLGGQPFRVKAVIDAPRC